MFVFGPEFLLKVTFPVSRKGVDRNTRLKSMDSGKDSL